MNSIREGETFEYSGRRITLFPIAKTGQFRVISSIAHILEEMAKEGVDLTKMVDSKGNPNLKSLTQTLMVIADRIEDDLDRIVDASTDDITIEELRAGRKEIAKDFDDDLYWEIIERLIPLNKEKIPKWMERGISLQKKVMLTFFVKEEESEEKAEVSKEEEIP